MSTKAKPHISDNANPIQTYDRLHPLVEDLNAILTEEHAIYYFLCPTRAGRMMGPSSDEVIDMMRRNSRRLEEHRIGSLYQRRNESKRDKTVRSVVTRIISELAEANIEFTLMWMLRGDEVPQVDSHGIKDGSEQKELCRALKDLMRWS